MSKLSIKITPKFKCIAEIPGYEDCIDYDIYRDGRVYSRKSKRFLTGWISDDDYLKVEMINGNTQSVHRLVALAFIPNPDGLPVVDHINGSKHDNVVLNLRWADRCDNAQNHRLHDSNSTGQDCIIRYISNRKNYIDCYHRIQVMANGNVYTKSYNIGRLPLDATQDEIDALYQANPITKEMTDHRDYLKELHHGQFSSTHRN